jgi:hypothetical protein
VVIDGPCSRMVGYPEAIADQYPMTSHVVYAASRISSNLKGSTKQFGWLQGSATKLKVEPQVLLSLSATC